MLSSEETDLIMRCMVLEASKKKGFGGSTIFPITKNGLVAARYHFSFVVTKKSRRGLAEKLGGNAAGLNSPISRVAQRVLLFLYQYPFSRLEASKDLIELAACDYRK